MKKRLSIYLILAVFALPSTMAADTTILNEVFASTSETLGNDSEFQDSKDYAMSDQQVMAWLIEGFNLSKTANYATAGDFLAKKSIVITGQGGDRRSAKQLLKLAHDLYLKDKAYDKCIECNDQLLVLLNDNGAWRKQVLSAMPDLYYNTIVKDIRTMNQTIDPAVKRGYQEYAKQYLYKAVKMFPRDPRFVPLQIQLNSMY